MLGTRACEVKDCIACFAVDGDIEDKRNTIVIVVNSGQHLTFVSLCEPLEQGADCVSCVCPNRLHVKVDYGPRILLDQCMNQLDAFLVGGNSGLEIGNIVVQRARSTAPGVLGRKVVETVCEAFLVKHAHADDFERFNRGTFLPELRGIRRHGTWLDTTDVSVVSPVGHEEDDFGRVLIRIEYRRNRGDICALCQRFTL